MGGKRRKGGGGKRGEGERERTAQSNQMYTRLGSACAFTKAASAASSSANSYFHAWLAKTVAVAA